MSVLGCVACATALPTATPRGVELTHSWSCRVLWYRAEQKRQFCCLNPCVATYLLSVDGQLGYSCRNYHHVPIMVYMHICVLKLWRCSRGSKGICIGSYRIPTDKSVEEPVTTSRASCSGIIQVEETVEGALKFNTSQALQGGLQAPGSIDIITL